MYPVHSLVLVAHYGEGCLNQIPPARAAQLTCVCSSSMDYVNAHAF